MRTLKNFSTIKRRKVSMNYSKTYLRYLIKKNYKVVLALFVLGFLLFPLPAILAEPYDYDLGVTPRQTDVFLYMGTVIVCFSAYILPMVLRSVFLDRKKCDLYLSLPIKKEKIYLLNSIFGYLSFFSCFTVLFLIVFIANTAKGKPLSIYYIYYYLGTVVISLSIFSLSSLISSLGNNLLDAVLMNVGVIVSAYIYYLLNIKRMGIFYYSILPISFADSFTNVCQKQIVGLSVQNLNDKLHEYNVSFVIHFAISVVCFYLSYLETKVFKSENAGERTYKKYSYPIVNGLLFSVLFTLIFKDFSILLTVVLVAVYFITEFIYRRKIKFERHMFIKLGIYLAIALAIRLNHVNGWISLS